MTTYEVRLLIDVPDEASLDDIERFVRFEFGATCRLDNVPECLYTLDVHSCNVRDLVVYAT